MFRDEKRVYVHKSRKSLYGYSDEKFDRMPKGYVTERKTAQYLHAAKQRLKFNERRLATCEDKSCEKYYIANIASAKKEIEHQSADIPLVQNCEAI